MILNKLRGLRLQLMIPVMVQVTIFVFVGIFSVRSIKKMGQDLRTETTIRQPLTHYSDEMTSNTNEVIQYGWSVYGATLKSERERIYKLAQKSMEDFEAAQTASAALPHSEQESESTKTIPEDWTKFKEVAGKVFEALLKMDAAQDEMAKYYLNSKLRPVGEKITSALEKADQVRLEIQSKETAESMASATRAEWLVQIFSLLSVIASAAVAMFMGERLIRRLVGIARQLEGGANQVATAAHDISSESASLSSCATEQSSILQETSAAVEQVNAMVGRNSDHAEQSVSISNQSSQVATNGMEVVKEMITSIEEINASNTQIMSEIERTNRENAEIVKLISEIGNKTKIINDIVFQTKLLSFNASVEAARAGEAGKGFAVVAEEVGNLAQMSGTAAKEIGDLLSNSVQKVEDLSRKTSERVQQAVGGAREKVERGTQVARRCEKVLEEIVKNVSEVNHRIGEISTASQEQSTSVKEITKAMCELEKVTQQNTSTSHVTAQSSDALARQAALLQQMVKDLLALVHGGVKQDESPVEVASAGETQPDPQAEYEQKAA